MKYNLEPNGLAKVLRAVLRLVLLKAFSSEKQKNTAKKIKKMKLRMLTSL